MTTPSTHLPALHRAATSTLWLSSVNAWSSARTGPLLPNDGAAMLLDAANAGHAEAALRLATLKALGAHVEQNWNDAFGLLVFAAERGSVSARGQLQALAGRAVGRRW